MLSNFLSTFYRLRYIMVVIYMAAIILLSGCDNKDEVIKDVSDSVIRRDYTAALKKMISLDDSQILSSDTLMQLLSTAYYGVTLKTVNGIAVDCYDMDFTPDGAFVIFTDFHNGTLNIYTWPKMEFSRTILLPQKAYATAVSPNGEMIACAMFDNTIILYSLSSGSRIKILEGHEHRVRDVVFRDDHILFSCSNDRKFAAWNVKTGEGLWGKHQHNKNIKNLQLSPDGTKLITASNDGTACIVNANDDMIGSELLRIVHGENYVNDAAISPDNQQLASVSGDGFLKIWDATNGCSLVYIPLNEPLSAVSFSPNGEHIIVGAKRNVYIIKSKNGAIVAKIVCRNSPIWNVAFLDNSTFVFADNSHFWNGKLLYGAELISTARNMSELLK